MSSAASVSVPLSSQVNENSSTESEQALEQGIRAVVCSCAKHALSSTSEMTSVWTEPSAGSVKLP